MKTQKTKETFSNYKSGTILLMLASLLTGPQALFAATIYVTPADSIQSAVNNASSGDTVLIFGGTYNEDVTVNGKQLSLQRISGQTVYLSGSLTWNRVSGSNGSPFVISNLKVGGDGSKRLVLNNCTNVTVDNMDLSAGGLTSIQSLNVSIGNSTIARVDGSSSSVAFARCVVNDVIVFDNNATTNLALNLFQCSVTNSIITYNGGILRLLYSNLRQITINNGNSIILGNIFTSPQGALNPGAIDLENGFAIIRNNDISITASPGDFGGYWGSWNGNNGLWVNNTQLVLANNFIHDLAGGGWERDNDREGVFISSASQKIEITGNIFWGTRRAVYAPFNNVAYRYNNDVEHLNHSGGVVSDCNISADPLFVNKAAGNFQLATNSPCVNAGPADAWYHDRDGSRNDMGIFGGSAYTPDGRTTDKPITFLLNATPLTVIKGYHTNLTVSGGGAVIAK